MAETMEKTTLTQCTEDGGTGNDQARGAVRAPRPHGCRSGSQRQHDAGVAHQYRAPLAGPAVVRWGSHPDSFLNVLQDALIKNFRDEVYDHLVPAEPLRFCRRRQERHLVAAPGDIKFHNGAPVTSDDIKCYHGAWAAVSHDSTDRVGIPDDHTLRFDFKVAFLDPTLKEFLIGAKSRQFGPSATRSRRSGRRSAQRCRYSAVWSLPRRRR
jgi:hypothetical protein